MSYENTNIAASYPWPIPPYGRPVQKVNVDISQEGEQKEVFTGAIPSMPDLRDYSDRHPRIRELIIRGDKLQAMDFVKAEELPDTIDLSGGFSPVEDQGNYGSCTAQAAVGLLEYMERKANGKHVDASRMFLYNATKWLLGWTGDTGAFTRTTMAALRLFGCPPEKYWPYETISLDQEPTGYVLSLAKAYSGITYFRHDAGPNTEPACALASIKKNLAAGIPSLFCFYGFNSFNDGGGHGDVPLPGPNEEAKWGHAVCAAGYKDDYVIENTNTREVTTGAILFRNSWGKDWGNVGYGRIPYEYFLRRYCWDMWSILSAEWVDTGAFGL